MKKDKRTQVQTNNEGVKTLNFLITQKTRKLTLQLLVGPVKLT